MGDMHVETILISSGFFQDTLAELQRHWNVVDICDPQEALAFLRTASPAPVAVTIGFVQSPKVDGTVDDAPVEGYMPAHVTLRKILELDADLPVIISTHQNHPAAIVRLIKDGAFDYVVEPPGPEAAAEIQRYNQELVAALRQAVRWRSTVLENRELRRKLAQVNHPLELQSRSPAMVRILQLVAKVALTSVPVLITGESGTGKEVIAQSIHRLSPQRRHPFLAINCGALSDSLLASELFGHVKGAFTGADRDNEGLIRHAGEGTLFLDELASVSPAFQVILLRVLEQRAARPVGGQREYPVRCRFIAASNRDLGELVKKGQFREDLFFRLQVVRLALPPLRERREDIPALSHYFLTQFNQTYGRSVTGFTPEAMRVLEQRDWSGNIRELRNAVERAVILCEATRIHPRDLMENSGAMDEVEPSDVAFDDYIHLCGSRLIRQTLQRCRGNVSETARILRMKRTTLQSRMKRLRLVAR